MANAYPYSPPVPYYPSSSNQRQYYQPRKQTYAKSPQSSSAYIYPPSPSPPSCTSPTSQSPLSSPQVRSSSSRPRTFYCLFTNCTYTSSRKADLERHVHVMHIRGSMQLINCAWPGCARVGAGGFTRKDKMVEHMRDVHKADIPKKKERGSGGEV